MTSSSGYTVSFQEMANQVDQLALHGQTLESELQDLTTRINTKLNPENWTSDAHTEWESAQHVWNQRGTDMHQKIVAAQKALTNIHDNYQLTEQQAKNMWANSGLADNGTGIATNR